MEQEPSTRVGVASSRRGLSRLVPGTASGSTSHKRHGWSRRHLALVLVAALAFAGNYAAVKAFTNPVRVARATGPLRSGEPPSAADIEFVEIRAEAATIEGLLTAEEFEAAVTDSVLTHELADGDFVTRASLRPATTVTNDLRAMSLPVDPGKAVAGDLSPGDVVDVITVSDGVAGYVATGAEVLAVGADSGPRVGFVGSASGDAFSVTIGVDPVVALELAYALQEGGVHVVRATGATDAGATPPFTPPGGIPPEGVPPGSGIRASAADDTDSVGQSGSETQSAPTERPEPAESPDVQEAGDG